LVLSNDARDVWDFDADANVILADLPIKGRTRQILMQANKNGYFYVIDRVTGDRYSLNRSRT